jgi:hypothetical protein
MASRPKASSVDDPAAPAPASSSAKRAAVAKRAGAVEPAEPAKRAEAAEAVEPEAAKTGWRPGPRAELALRIGGGILVTLVAFEAAVIECFLVPLHVGRVAVPLAALLAIVGNLVFPRMMVTVARRRTTALLPPVLWLVVVLVFSAPRSEGDLIVPGTWPALLFLFLGAIVGAYGAASSVMGGTPWRPASRAAGAGSSGGAGSGSGGLAARGSASKRSARVSR